MPPMPLPEGTFAAVILAADRGPDDPVARAAGVRCKALAPVAGRPMVLRVLDTLEAVPGVGRPLVCGPREPLFAKGGELASREAAGRLAWLEPRPSPSRSVLAALETLPAEKPVLVTTADHPLLTPAMVEHFCAGALESGCDVVAGLAPYGRIAEAFPESRRTVTRLQDGGVCGCNLFAFLTPRGRRAAEFWQRVEQQRKNPLKVIRTVGWAAVLRYLVGRLTLEEGLKRLSAAMGAQAGAVLMPFAEAAVDVDKGEDLELVEKILAYRERSMRPE